MLLQPAGITTALKAGQTRQLNSGLVVTPAAPDEENESTCCTVDILRQHYPWMWNLGLDEQSTAGLILKFQPSP